MEVVDDRVRNAGGAGGRSVDKNRAGAPTTRARCMLAETASLEAAVVRSKAFIDERRCVESMGKMSTPSGEEAKVKQRSESGGRKRA